MPYNLKELGIRSDYHAAELEDVLGIKFSNFNDSQLDIWQRQNIALNQFALTRSYTLSAQIAGVTVYTIRAWEQNNVLGYAQRKEIADLTFCDWLEGLLIERVQHPDAPPSLLAMLIRAHMPEKYGSARRNGAPSDDHEHSSAQPPLPQGEGDPPTPESDPSSTPNLSPDVAEDITPSPSVSSVPSAVNPSPPSVRREPVEGPKRDSQSTHTVIPANAGIHPSPSVVNPPAPQHLTRRQRRQLQRKQRKSRQKARAPN